MCVHHVCMTLEAWVSAYSADEVSFTKIVSEITPSPEHIRRVSLLGLQIIAFRREVATHPKEGQVF